MNRAICARHNEHIYGIVTELCELYPDLPFSAPHHNNISLWCMGPLILNLSADSYLHSIGVVAISIASPSSDYTNFETIGTHIEIAFMNKANEIVKIFPDKDSIQHFEILGYHKLYHYIQTMVKMTVAERKVILESDHSLKVDTATNCCDAETLVKTCIFTTFNLHTILKRVTGYH